MFVREKISLNTLFKLIINPLRQNHEFNKLLGQQNPLDHLRHYHPGQNDKEKGRVGIKNTVKK
eukprot:UN20797